MMYPIVEEGTKRVWMRETRIKLLMKRELEPCRNELQLKAIYAQSTTTGKEGGSGSEGRIVTYSGDDF